MGQRCVYGEAMEAFALLKPKNYIKKHLLEEAGKTFFQYYIVHTDEYTSPGLPKELGLDTALQ